MILLLIYGNTRLPKITKTELGLTKLLQKNGAVFLLTVYICNNANTVTSRAYTKYKVSRDC